MCYLGAIGAVIGAAATASVSVGSLGVFGLTKKITKVVKGDNSSDSVNNKIQSIIATFLLTALGAIFSSAFLVGAVVINLPYLAKLLVRDSEMKERLDNIAGFAGATINSLALLPLLLIAC